MQLKNRIINYFVTQPYDNGMPKVFMCPVTIPSETGKKLLADQLKKQGLHVPPGHLLHVCYDLDSERIYIPNANLFSKENKEYLLKAAEIRIAKDFGGVLNVKPIEGSPFTSVRVRAVSSFGYVVNSIKQHFNDKEFVDLPVIEANLARMPTTMKQLPQIFSNKNFTGGYISPSQKQVVSFIDELELNGRKREKPILVFQQKPPFILLNTAPEIEIKAADKERNVLLGYRDFLYDKAVDTKQTEQKEMEKVTNFADLYAAKRFLYLGYPFEEVCSVFLESSRNFAELYSGIQRLMSAAEELASEGHTNPSTVPYYLTFKIDPNTFPLKLASISSNNKFDPYRQLPYFFVIEYDSETNYVLIQTPAFISPNLCMKILRAKNRPLITHYNDAVGKSDVKSTEGVFKEYKVQEKQLSKITALTKHDVISRDHDKKVVKDPKDVKIEYRTDNRARGVSMSNSEVCNLRRVSDYYYACDRIKSICKKRGVPFIDLPVVIGPIERIMGQGTQGGFMSRQSFEKQKLKIPFEIEKGLLVNPPLIAINSVSMTGYDEQTTTLIHEYCHNLFNITNPDYEHQYNNKENQSLKNKNPNKWWDIYLSDIDERQAHKEQIKHELISGDSPDEIIRDKVGGVITTSNYPIALKMKELVDEAMREIEQEEKENEKPIGTDQRIGRNPSGVTQDRQ